jgi:hypothetical protein
MKDVDLIVFGEQRDRLPERAVIPTALDPRSTDLLPLPNVPLALHRAEAEPGQAALQLTDISLQIIRQETGTQAVAA